MSQVNLTNKEIASLLREIAAAYEAKGADRFKVVAYERAADSIERSSEALKELWQRGNLSKLSGVGPSIAQHLGELFETGRVKHFAEVKKDLPEGMFTLLKVPGIGPKGAFFLAKELNLKTVAGLERAAREGKIATLPGFGEKSQKEILRGILDLRKRQDRILLSSAYEIAQKIIARLSPLSQVERVDPLGSLRRMCPTVGDIDLAVAVSNKPQEVLEVFVSMPEVDRVLASGRRKASVLLKSGFQVDLRVQDVSSYGAQLQYFTGSKHHNVALRTLAQKKGFSLSEYGIKNLKTGKLTKFSSEEKFYGLLGLEWIPPELREDQGEIEAAAEHKLPKVLSYSAVKGDLHVHSDFETSSPLDAGKSSVEEVLAVAKSLDYEYLGFADHSPRLSMRSVAQIKKELKRRKSYIEHFSGSQRRMRVLIGLEVDILADGSLSIPEVIHSELDYLIVSIHSAHRQPREKITQRLLSALTLPKVKVLGHPTGRLLLEREAYDADWEKIYRVCAQNKVFVELNASPSRLDLPDLMAREARKKGVKFIINTDAHDAESLKNVRYGIALARRAWLEKKEVVNTLPFEKFRRQFLS